MSKIVGAPAGTSAPPVTRPRATRPDPAHAARYATRPCARRALDYSRGTQRDSKTPGIDAANAIAKNAVNPTAPAR